MYFFSMRKSISRRLQSSVGFSTIRHGVFNFVFMTSKIKTELFTASYYFYSNKINDETVKY